VPGAGRRRRPSTPPALTTTTMAAARADEPKRAKRQVPSCLGRPEASRRRCARWLSGDRRVASNRVRSARAAMLPKDGPA